MAPKYLPKPRYMRSLCPAPGMMTRCLCGDGKFWYMPTASCTGAEVSIWPWITSTGTPRRPFGGGGTRRTERVAGHPRDLSGRLGINRRHWMSQPISFPAQEPGAVNLGQAPRCCRWSEARRIHLNLVSSPTVGIRIYGLAPLCW